MASEVVFTSVGSLFLQLKHNNWNIKVSVLAALKETGYSMIYSAIVLFFGFSIFSLFSSNNNCASSGVKDSLPKN